MALKVGLFSSEETRCFASIETAQHGPVEGVVVDNDASSVLIQFPLQKGPLLPIAEEVVLKLRANDPGVSTDVRARVVHCGRNDDSVRYRFRLPARDAPSLVRLFRRRNAFRARPDPRNPVVVLLDTADGLRSKAELFDISMTGVALVVDADDESRLFRAEPLKLTFRLPGQPKLFELNARIRTRTLVGSAIRYGLEFEPEASTRPALQGESIMQYVMERQLDMIRSGRETW